MSREKVKEIVDYMVSEGIRNTNYGCWAFDIKMLSYGIWLIIFRFANLTDGCTMHCGVKKEIFHRSLHIGCTDLLYFLSGVLIGCSTRFWRFYMNESFGACTQLAGRCAVCPKVSTCDHKRMEHLGYIIPSPDLNVSIVVARANGKSLSQLEIVDSLMKRRFNYESR